MESPARGDLLALLATISDPRRRKGRRHQLPAMLAAIVCGILAGAQGCTAIAQWIHEQEASFWHQLGFLRKPPTTNGFRYLLLKLPPETLESVIGQWVNDVLEARELEAPADAWAARQAIAIDGKTLRGAMQQHGRSLHLLSLLDHATGSVLSQLKMPAETNEHKAALELLKTIVLRGTVITGDAMFCQREVCQQIVDAGGDYLFTVKDNQPDLRSAIEADFRPGFSPLHRGSATAAVDEPLYA